LNIQSHDILKYANLLLKKHVLLLSMVKTVMLFNWGIYSLSCHHVIRGCWKNCYT